MGSNEVKDDEEITWTWLTFMAVWGDCLYNSSAAIGLINSCLCRNEGLQWYDRIINVELMEKMKQIPNESGSEGEMLRLKKTHTEKSCFLVYLESSSDGNIIVKEIWNLERSKNTMRRALETGSSKLLRNETILKTDNLQLRLQTRLWLENIN